MAKKKEDKKDQIDAVLDLIDAINESIKNIHNSFKIQQLISFFSFRCRLIVNRMAHRDLCQIQDLRIILVLSKLYLNR